MNPKNGKLYIMGIYTVIKTYDEIALLYKNNYHRIN